MTELLDDDYEEEYDDAEPEIPSITIAQAALYVSTRPLLHAMALEFAKLSLKKPETTLSRTKVTFVNRLLADLKGLLAEESTIKYLDLLTDDELPQYSDVVLILSQYEAAMTSFHSRYFNRREERWNLQDDPDLENEDSENEEGDE